MIEKERKPEDFILATQQNSIVGRTEKEAQDKHLKLMRLIPNNSILSFLFFGSAEKVAEQIQEWHAAETMNMLILQQEYPVTKKQLVQSI